MAENTTLKAYGKVLKSVGLFLLAYAIFFITYHTLPLAIDFIFGGGILGRPIYYLLIVFWVGLMVIFPSWYVISAYKDITPDKNNMIIGLAWLVLTGLLLYWSYFIFPVFAGFLDDALVKGIYWVGTLLYIGLAFIGTPVVSIVKGAKG